MKSTACIPQHGSSSAILCQAGHSPPESHDSRTYLNSAMTCADSGGHSHQVIDMEEGHICSHMEHRKWEGIQKIGGHTGKGEIIQETEGFMLGPVREDHPIWCAYPHLLLPAATSSSDHEKLGNIQSTNPFFFSSLTLCTHWSGQNGYCAKCGTSCGRDFLHEAFSRMGSLCGSKRVEAVVPTASCRFLCFPAPVDPPFNVFPAPLS